MFSDLYNISGTHCDEYITFLAAGEKIVLDFIKCRIVFAGSTELLDTFLQIFRRDTQSIGFSCCIDIGNYDMICQAECFCKFRKQSLGTCICMRLKYTP